MNAPVILEKIKAKIKSYGQDFHIAVVQADVIAHSMGGTITRTMVTLPEFLVNKNYQQSYINKLITIDTPHLGAHLSNLLLQDANKCVRDLLAGNKSISIGTAVVAGKTENGAVGDLQDGGLGPGTNNLRANQPFQIGYIAGTADVSNFASLDCSVCVPRYIRSHCSGSSIAQNLSLAQWDTLFNGEANDAIVGRNSQLNDPSGTVAGLRLPHVIHSAALTALGFTGPAVLSKDGNAVGIVINLLNEDPKGNDFTHQ